VLIRTLMIVLGLNWDCYRGELGLTRFREPIRVKRLV
jgi:hypothetical protein